MPQEQKACPGYQGVTPSRFYWTGDIFGNNNYQQGGYNLVAQSFGMSRFEHFDVSGWSNNGGTYMLIPDWSNTSSNVEQQAPTPANLLVKCYYSANSVEVANNTDLKAACWRVNVVGV